jgi:acyl-CoA synthetase (NDP forming)
MNAQISGERLTTLFRPRSVAPVGASDKSVISMIAYGNLVQFGFGDRTYLGQPAGAVTHGRPAVRSCAEIGEPVDVAFLMVPQTGMLEAELAAHAQSLGMALLGPNHLGFANFTEGIPVPAAARVDGATVDGVLVTPMRRGGIELLIGAVRDPQWGPMLAVALGGLFVEVLRDSALALAPVSAEQARRMLEELRGRAVLDGIGGAAPADLEGLAAVIARAGDLAVALGDDLDSLEINPLRVDGAVIEALDAVVTWAGKDNG